MNNEQESQFLNKGLDNVLQTSKESVINTCKNEKEKGKENNKSNINNTYHQVRIVIPIRYYVKPNGILKIFEKFSNNAKWEEIDVESADGNGKTRNADYFINSNARIHQEIVDIFRKKNNQFRLFRYKLSESKDICDKINTLLWYDMYNNERLDEIEESSFDIAQYIKNKWNNPTLFVDNIKLYLFESGIGFFEYQIKFRWGIVQADDFIVKFCTSLRAKNFDTLRECSRLLFIQKENNKDADLYESYSPAFYFAIFLQNRKKNQFQSYIKRAVSKNSIQTTIGDTFLKIDGFYLSIVSNAIFRVGKYKWDINDQAAWFSFIFVLHQKYALRSLSNQLAKIDEKHDFSPSTSLKNRLRQEEINYANFRRRYVFENISNQTGIQKMYDFISEKFDISKLLDEYVHSITPLQEYARVSRENIRNSILFAFSMITVFNIIMVYIKLVIDIDIFKIMETDGANIFCLVGLIIIIIAIFFFCFYNNAKSKRILVNKLKVKNIDKNKK